MIIKKKICLIIPSLQAGGMERVMSELAGYFARKKELELHLVLYGIKRDIFYQIPDQIMIYKPRFKFNNRWRFFYTLKTLFYLRYIIKKINPEKILSFGEYWNNFLLISLFGLKYTAFVSDRSQPDKSLGWIHDKLRQLLYPQAMGLIFQTQKAKELFLSKNRHPNTIVIGNPVKSINQVTPDIKREKNVLMVGRLIMTKHQDRLIKMFARISLPGWKLIIVGYDHLKQENMERLKKLAKDLNVEQKVVFMGKVENVDETYLRCSIFAFTSSSEGFPNVMGEAMAAGLPVIAYDCVAGPSEMITDGFNGYLVPLFDDRQFESKLIQLMINEDLRRKLGSSAKESIMKFSSKQICEAYYRFITN